MYVLELLTDGEHSLVEMMQICGYKDRDSFREAVLNQMLQKTLRDFLEVMDIY